MGYQNFKFGCTKWYSSSLYIAPSLTDPIELLFINLAKSLLEQVEMLTYLKIMKIFVLGNTLWTATLLRTINGSWRGNSLYVRALENKNLEKQNCCKC